MPRAVILTALPVEYSAIRSHLSDLSEETHPQGTIYEKGRFFVNRHITWEVGIAEIGSGNAEAAAEAERAIGYFKPDVLLFVGIAGGIKDVAIGDVVAATKVYDCETGKVENQFLSRPTLKESAYALVQRARTEARQREWLQRLSDQTVSQPHVFVAPIAAGEKVVASKQSEFFKFIRANYNDAIAVEMEGFGFLRAASAYPNIKAMVIRGISDLIDRKNDNSVEPEQVRQEIASRHASAFAFELLTKFDLSLDKGERNKELCNLPHKSRNKFIGRRKEIDELLMRISDNYRQHLTVLKGIGGVGKTALVLEVAYRCWDAKENNNTTQNIPIFDAIIFSSSKATDLVDTKLLERPEKEPTLSDIFRIIAETLNEPTITQVPTEQQMEQVRKALAKQRTLLIIDNMETLEAGERDKVLAFLNNVPAPTQVMITTREHLGIDAILINNLTKSESISLITEQAKAKGISIKGDQKKQLYKRFSGIPVALIYAIGQRAAGYDFAQILKPTTQLPEDLGRFCFETSIKPLREKAAYKLLLAMTFFRDSSCREALIKVAGLASQTQETRDNLAKLLQLSLVSEQEGRYTILPITREYVIAELARINNPDFKNELQERWIEWYLKFTKQYGGLDWDAWRTKYDRLEEEWANIESVLYFCAAHERWEKVIELWQNIDNYVDLNGYWQKRRHWWALLAKKTGSTHVEAKALAEKAWTLILMGEEHYSEAETCLKNAWSLRESTTIAVQACTANYFAVLAKNRGNFQDAYHWLSTEQAILRNSQLDKEERMRYMVRNFYYLAEINYVEGNMSLAEENFQLSIQWGEKVKWQRFINYAQNGLAYVYIEETKLEDAEHLLYGGLSVANSMRETRRIALYHAGFAKLYYKKFKQVNQNQALKMEAIEKLAENLHKSKDYAEKALNIFSKEKMVSEQQEMRDLLKIIDDLN